MGHVVNHQKAGPEKKLGEVTLPQQTCQQLWVWVQMQALEVELEDTVLVEQGVGAGSPAPSSPRGASGCARMIHNSRASCPTSSRHWEDPGHMGAARGRQQKQQ